jgi:protein-S-isoprenylcysteine O-methyltransferase Ste14
MASLPHFQNRTPSPGPASFTARGGVWVVCQGLLMSAVFVLGLVFRRDISLIFRAIAAGLFVLAALTGLAGAVALGKGLTPLPKPTADTQLVQTGIYSLMRHPLYTAVLCGLWGWALFWGSWPSGAAAMGAVVFFLLKARLEERWLRERLAGYADYERRVKRFIPWIY